jgi:hypothetical protein
MSAPYFAFAAIALCAPNYGRFVGDVITKWRANGRDMILLKEFRYIDPDGKAWIAPAGATVDGASIPQIGWSVIGGPFEGKYRDASVIHDVACQEKSRPWQEVHRAFFFAMLANRVEPWKAKVMYAAVYHFGPRWQDLAPPPENRKRLSKEDFERLKNEIKRREEKGRTAGQSDPAAPMQLSEIEKWSQQ